MLDTRQLPSLHRERTPRRCAASGCSVWLSSLNESATCWHHDALWSIPEPETDLELVIRREITEAVEKTVNPRELIAA